MADVWAKTSELRALANLMPMFVPTLCALDLDGYRSLPRHDDLWLATRLGLSVDEIRYASKVL